MAGDVIKSATVKVGADTKDFLSGMNKIDKSINQTVRTADHLTNALKIKYDDTQFQQAQKHVQSALETTRDKAETVRAKLKEMEAAGRVDTIDYQKLQTELAKTEASATLLEKKLKDINNLKFETLANQVKKVGDGVSAVGKALAPLSVAAGAAAAGILKLTSDAAKSGAELLTASQKYDLTTDSIQALNYAALQSGVPAETLYKAYSKARLAIGKGMLDDTGKAAAALETLGVRVESFRNQEEAFYGIIDALADVKDKNLQAVYASDIFGEKIANDIIPLLAQGKGAIAAYNEEFKQIGGLSEEQVKKLAEMNQGLNRVKTAFENAKNELAIALLPVLQSFVDFLSNYAIPFIRSIAEWFDKLPGPVKNAALGFLLVVAALAPLLLIGGKVINMFGNMIKKLPDLLNKLKANEYQALKTAAGFAAIAGAMFLAIDLIGNWKKMSTVEKILKTLAVAALVAAAAVTVFHASWSLGIAVGAIAAGVVAGIAAIKAASEDIGIDAGISDKDSITSAAGGGTSWQDYQLDAGTGAGSYYSDSSITQGDTNFYITMNATGNIQYDVDELEREISRRQAEKYMTRR